ncbi:four and a half LIM domains protein 3 [Caerostris darwini]|uniref:Four and a half LIM domains protein 3 n=1 Tax=Caerostris darwini TaxID=1538125 RepID=A0AAV4RCT0_9ARAC|nr:four and a half LIM domains protein 3 [Caerostris darwini]
MSEAVCDTYQPHERRNICQNCKHVKDEHPLTEKDIKELRATVATLAEDSGAEPPRGDSVYEWIPPECPEDRMEDYFSCFPEDKVPKYNSEGLQWCQKTLSKQVPAADFMESDCRFVDKDSLIDFEEHAKDIRNKALHFGFVKVRFFLNPSRLQ